MSAPVEPGFEQILNFRDVAVATDHLSANQHLKAGLLFRSARPDNATLGDREKLISIYNIKTIIDLRSKSEHKDAAKKQAERAPSPSGTSSPLKIPGIHYAEISLNGRGYERALLKGLSWTNTTKLVTLVTLGYRSEGISVLGKNVMQSRGLTGLGIDTLAHSQKEIKEAFLILADPKSYPVMVHCIQGKDRTGLIILLVLLLCGVEVQSISQDYMRSEGELEPEKEERLVELGSMGLDESFATCPTDFAERVVQHINQHYDGIQSYLNTIGVSIEAQHRIRSILEGRVRVDTAFSE